jgi:hypothetical protein
MLALLLERAMVTPPAGDAAVRRIVQVDVPGAFTVAGEQVIEPGCTSTVRPTDVDCVAPLSEALTETFCAVVTAAVAAAKVAVLWPAEMVTPAGTVNAALLLLSAIVPATRAALFSAMVQVLKALLLNAAGEHDTEEICAGAIALRVKVLKRPLRVAVRMAV